MSITHSSSSEPERPSSPQLTHRSLRSDHPPNTGFTRLRRFLGLTLPVVFLLGIICFFAGRYWIRQAMRDALPQLDGSISVAGLSAPVTVVRDAHGVPHIRAASLDDLIVAQGYVTAQDRLWQMDAMRRHAAGELAEVLGTDLVAHDRSQRFLQLRASADRAVSVLPPDQMHWLELYARGVNASIAAQASHLPIEFRILRYQPAPWTPRDSILVSLAMYQDLTTSFPTKLAREVLARKLKPELLDDLYPVGSWRDHPPAQPVPDLTAPQTDIPDIPLDESQTRLSRPAPPALSTESILQLQASLAPFTSRYTCDACLAGSNNWVVSGSHTSTGKPLLSNDMHLSHGVPGIWYEAALESPTASGNPFHVAGVTLPGAPFVIVGHNDHVAWGFTNLGAEVQDVYIEHLRGSGTTAEFQAADGTWRPLLHQRETIHVHGQPDIVLDVAETQHGGAPTPILSGLIPKTVLDHDERTLSLRWTIYDPANLTSPFFDINTATDSTSLVAAFSSFGGPSQNLVYADDQGHIGYHATGRIPLRGSLTTPSPISPVPTDASLTANEWVGYIPYDQLPQSFDPPGGIIATANARISPDGYPFPLTLDWAAPYRAERIYKVLTNRDHLTPSNMLALQTDVYSEVDRIIAQRLAYAIDNSKSAAGANGKRLHQAADLLRSWDGQVDANAAAPAIVDGARAALWPLLLIPQLGPGSGDMWKLYTWSEKSFAEEQLIMHTPARWLPPQFASWDDLLTAAVQKGLLDDQAPNDLSTWHYGAAHPLDIEHPILGRSALVRQFIGYPVGTGVRPQSGDGTTVKQVGRSFGPSERFTADLYDFDHSTLNIVLGQSADPASPYFIDQFPAWYNATTFPLPFTTAAVRSATVHTLTLNPG